MTPNSNRNSLDHSANIHDFANIRRAEPIHQEHFGSLSNTTPTHFIAMSCEVQSHDSDELCENHDEPLGELEVRVGVFDVHAVSKNDVLKVLNGELVAVEDDDRVQREEAELGFLQSCAQKLVKENPVVQQEGEMAKKNARHVLLGTKHLHDVQ